MFIVMPEKKMFFCLRAYLVAALLLKEADRLVSHLLDPWCRIGGALAPLHFIGEVTRRKQTWCFSIVIFKMFSLFSLYGNVPRM